MLRTERVHKQLGKGLDYGEIGDKFGAGASTAGEKVNSPDNYENLFRLVPIPGHGACVLPLKLVSVPTFLLGHQQNGPESVH